MKKLIAAAVLASASLAPAVAQEKGCSLIGSWVSVGEQGGTDAVPWTAIITGRSSSSGVLVVHAPVWPGLEWVASVTLTGTWERTSGNTFAFTQVGFIPGPDGLPLLYVKNVGTDTITEDCNALVVHSTMELFTFPDMEQVLPPTLVATDMIAKRIVVEEMVDE